MRKILEIKKILINILKHSNLGHLTVNLVIGIKKPTSASAQNNFE